MVAGLAAEPEGRKAMKVWGLVTAPRLPRKLGHGGVFRRLVPGTGEDGRVCTVFLWSGCAMPGWLDEQGGTSGLSLAGTHRQSATATGIL